MCGEKHTGTPIPANCRVLPPLGLLMHRETGSLICKHASQCLAECLWQHRQTLVSRKRHSVILAAFFLPQSGCSHLEVLLVKEEILFRLCHLGSRGLWASSTTSLNLSLFIKWVQVCFLGVGVYFVCLWTCLCRGRRTWRTESVLRVFLNPVPLYYFWDRVSHCSWKSLMDLLVSEFQTASFLCPPPPSAQGLQVNATRPAFHIRAGHQNLGPQVLQGLNHLPRPQIILLI